MSSIFFDQNLQIAVGLLLFMQVAMFLYYLIRKSKVNKCPKCGNVHSGVRVGRPFLVKVFLSPYISDIRYYKCLNCLGNFFVTTNIDEVRLGETNNINKITNSI